MMGGSPQDPSTGTAGPSGDGESLLSGLMGDQLVSVLQAASDIALVVAGDGRILESIEGSGFSSSVPTEWLGQNWNDVVTPETRPKVRAILEEGRTQGFSRERQLNHPMPDGSEVPVGYTAVRIGPGDRLLAVGKDLRALADLQQQLVEAQRTMESEYWQIRQAEARYRLLFQQSTEPVLLVDPDDLRVTDANNAAGSVLGVPPARLVGRSFPPSGLRGAGSAAEADLRGVVEELVRSGDDGLRLSVTLGSDVPWVLRLSLVRFDSERVVLARLTPEREGDRGRRRGVDVFNLLENAPDGFVVADLDGNILMANDAFIRMAQVSGTDAVEGRSLGLWLGRPGADLTVLLTSLKRGGQIRFFSTTVQGEHGLSSQVELSAVSARDADIPCMGIVLRDVSSRLGVPRGGAKDLNRAVSDLTNQVGRVSLKHLVEDTVSLVELHFIDAALQLTGDNRTAAAELLGLSRQSLYTKLKRYKIDGPDSTN